MNKPQDFESWVAWLLTACILLLGLLVALLVKLVCLSFTHRPIELFYMRCTSCTYKSWAFFFNCWNDRTYVVRLFGLTLLLEPRNKIK